MIFLQVQRYVAGKPLYRHATIFLLGMTGFLSGCATLSGGDESYRALLQAEQAYARKDWVDAERLYRMVEKVSQNDNHVKFRLGNTLANQGRYSEAIQIYQGILESGSRDAKVFNNLAIMYLVMAEKTLGDAVIHVSPNDHFGRQSCSLLSGIRGLEINESQRNPKTIVARWCVPANFGRNQKTESKSVAKTQPRHKPVAPVQRAVSSETKPVVMSP